MRRMMLLVTVGLVMAAMMLAIAMPAFADSPWSESEGFCVTKQGKPGEQFTREGTNKVITKCFVDPTLF
jgi:hypothetical protein